MDNLRIAYSTLKSITSDGAVKVYWAKNADGSYRAWFTTDSFFCTCDVRDIADISDFVLSGSAANEVGSEDDARILSYVAAGGAKVQPRARDGRPATRNTTANRATNFNLRVFSFYTAMSGSVHNVNPVTEADWADITYTMYDASGSVVSDPSLSGTVVKTVIDWEPHYNYEIIGGYMDIPTELKDGKTDQWYLGGVGVPDLPPEMFGSVPYISEINLEAITAQRVVSDGKAISYLPYKLYGYPTNKLRFYVKHPAGAQERFQFYVEHFV